MPTYEFTVKLQGDGDDWDEAWEDAVLSFALDPGEVPVWPHPVRVDDVVEEERT